MYILLAKQQRLSFPSHNHMSTIPFALLHLDTWGPFATESIDGFKYFLTIVNDYSRVTWVYMLKNKSEVTIVFPKFLKLISTQYGGVVKAIRTDNAHELLFTDLIEKHGIIHYFFCAYTPQQNYVVERKHQHLLNVARSLLFQSNVPVVYWSDCVLTAAFLINRTPSPLLKDRSPYEVLLKKIPNYSRLKTFGCLCYVSTLQKDRNKFTARSRSSIFLGYPSGYKGYKVLDLDTRSITTRKQRDTEGKNRRCVVGITLFRRHTEETSPRK